MKDFKPNWDPKRHDESIPTQERVEVAKFACKCGNPFFVAVHKAQVHLIISKKAGNVQFENPPLLLCPKCNEMHHPSNIIQEVIRARELANQQNTQKPQEKIH